jgi:hypothetical protein
LGTGTHRSPTSYAVGLGAGRRRRGMICFSSLGWGRKLYTFHIGGKDMEISEMITRVSSDRLKEELPKNLADLEVHVGAKLNRKCAQRGSNSQPLVPKTSALSN